jgi:hypothetical protein
MSIHGVLRGKRLTAPTEGISFGRWNWETKACRVTESQAAKGLTVLMFPRPTP